MKTPDGRSYKSTVWHQRVHTTYKKWSGRRSCGTDSRSHHLLPAGVDSFGPVCSFEGRQGANIDAPDIWTAACAKKKYIIFLVAVFTRSPPRQHCDIVSNTPRHKLRAAKRENL